MVAGGTESCITPLGIAGFTSLTALTSSDHPEKASCPFDKKREGFVMGEGSAIVVLEELEHAKRRGAKIYAELIGYGCSSDAYHITSPAEDGSGAATAMLNALKTAVWRRRSLLILMPMEPAPIIMTYLRQEQSSWCLVSMQRISGLIPPNP